MTNNRITELFGIKYPVIQGGVLFLSIVFSLVILLIDIIYAIVDPRIRSDKPWGVNVPLMYPEIDRLIDLLIEEKVGIVFTSAGSPKKYTQRLHDAGMKVVHVVSSSKFARKCEEAGVDAIVAEGFEAGGHNGREETTTLTLIPQVRKATSLPLIAAGGIGSGQAMLAAMALGAEGVQIGTLFALTEESSASEAFKSRCTQLEEGDTMLTLKLISPTRMVKNDLYNRIHEAEQEGATVEDLRAILGKAASKRGIFEGEIENGELEIGQIASAIKEVLPVSAVMKQLIEEYDAAKERIAKMDI